MPLLSMFYGIIIRMNWKDDGKHKLPHIHAEYAGKEAVFTLDGEIIEGDFPATQKAYVKAWTLIHADELQADWKLAVNGEQIFKISPLV